MTRTDWYALHVVGDYAKHLRRSGLDPFVPTEERITYARRHHATIRRRTERPLFPGLAFVHMATPRWHKVLAVPCVTGVFMPYGEPYRFLSADMVTLGALGNRPALLPYSRGDAVRFVTGPLVDVTMKVADVDFRRGEVKLLAEIMGRVAEISARAGDVRKCA
jgi:transcription antitermination factor NusG